MFDFSEIDAATESRQLSWTDFLAEGEVYALTIPERADHIEELLEKWDFTNANIFFGILKETISLAEWAKQGRIERNELVTEGRVACHFGHRGIMEEFLRQAPASKKWVLIFEDDLIDMPKEEMQHNLLNFWAEVPEDFDILHLGFLWEDRHGREQVSSLVYRTNMAVGRHAYVVTRRGAQTLLKATYPQVMAGDEMYKKAIHDHSMAAYQPSVPLFRQDREKFMSKILMYKRPARDFRPEAEALKQWQDDAQAAKTRFKDLPEERKRELSNADPKLLEALAWKYEDRKANPKINVREPMLLVGSINDWSPEAARLHHPFSILCEKNASELPGEWRIHEDKILRVWFSAEASGGGGLRAAMTLWPGTDVEGPMEEDGIWQCAELCFSDGSGFGSLAVRWDEGHSCGIMSFKFNADTEWGSETIIDRVRQDEDSLEVEHAVVVKLKPGAPILEFQVISDRQLWDWRLYPAKGAKTLTLKQGERESVPAAICVDKDDMSYHGRNFAITEKKGGVFTIRVLLRRRGRLVWYTKGEERPPQPVQQPTNQAMAALARATPSAFGAPPSAWELQAATHEDRGPPKPKDCASDMVTPVRIVGDFINWDLKARGCELFLDPFHNEDEWQPYKLQVRLTDGKLSFQIASSKLGLNWRCFPELVKNGVCVLEPYTSSSAAHAKIGGEKDGEGKSFGIKEPAGTVVAILLWLKAEALPWHMGVGTTFTAAEVSYERVPGSPGRCTSFGLNPLSNYRMSQIKPVRLVGECVKWNVRAPGLEFKVNVDYNSSEWEEHRLCCRLQGDYLDFQIVSSNLGFEWRCFPKECTQGVCKLPRGKNNAEVVIGGKNEGHGRNFRVEAPVFSAVTISVWLRLASEPDIGGDRCRQVMVTYVVQDTGVTVGIGPSHVQFPLRKKH